MSDESKTDSSALCDQDEAIIWFALRRGYTPANAPAGASAHRVLFDLLDRHYDSVAFNYIYNVVRSVFERVSATGESAESAESTSSPTADEMADVADARYIALAAEIHDSAMTELRSRIEAGEYAQPAADADGPEQSFGYYLRLVIEWALDEHPVTNQHPGWRAHWEISTRRMPFGVWSFFRFEDALADRAIHWFTRKFHFQLSNGMLTAGSIGRMEVYAAAIAGRNCIRDLMERTYQYPEGVALMNAISHRPLYRQLRVMLHTFYGLDKATVLVLCPPDLEEDGTKDGETILARLDSDETEVMEVSSWGQMRVTLRERAGGNP